MRVALVHDWLTGMRGGERVLHEMAAVYPGADLYTLIHVPGSTSERIERLRIHASPLSRLPGARRHYRKFLPLYPWAIERFRLEGYDLVLSSSHAFAKGVRTPSGAVHVCYCHTPMRYIWDQCSTYLGEGVKRALAAPLVGYLRRWDLRTSGPDRVARFLANSRTVASRIERHYGRSAEVVYPPVDADLFRPLDGPSERFYLLVSSFVPYKREDVAIEAFGRLARPLVVVGDGPGRSRLMAGAPANVTFLGRVSDATLADLYARCLALVHPQEEDLGLVALEVQASGRPVLAYARGGATETVVPLGAAGGASPTGVWFDEQTPEALEEAVRRFEGSERDFDPRAIRAHAGRFGKERFRREIAAAAREALASGPRV